MLLGPNLNVHRGGSQVLSNSMANYVGEKTDGRAIQLNSHVTGISLSSKAPSTSRMRVSLQDQPERKYSHVISTVALPCLYMMDLDNSCGFSTVQTNALRELQYGSSTKIGMKFRTSWWTTEYDLDGEKIDIVGGQSYTDLPIRYIVYPSQGTVMVASYCWSEDARRLGSLIDAGQAADDQLKDLVLRNLAKVHNVSVQMLCDEYVAHFAYDWGHNPRTMVMFIFLTLRTFFFAPGLFRSVHERGKVDDKFFAQAF